MSEQRQPAEVGPVELGLGPLPEPVAWFRAPYGTLEPNPLFRVTGPQSLEWAVACFTEDQLRAAVAAAVQFSRNAQDDAYVCGRNDEREAIAKWLEGQGQPGYAHEVRHRA